LWLAQKNDKNGLITRYFFGKALYAETKGHREEQLINYAHKIHLGNPEGLPSQEGWEYIVIGEKVCNLSLKKKQTDNRIKKNLTKK